MLAIKYPFQILRVIAPPNMTLTPRGACSRDSLIHSGRGGCVTSEFADRI